MVRPSDLKICWCVQTTLLIVFSVTYYSELRNAITPYYGAQFLLAKIV